MLFVDFVKRNSVINKYVQNHSRLIFLLEIGRLHCVKYTFQFYFLNTITFTPDLFPTLSLLITEFTILYFDNGIKNYIYIFHHHFLIILVINICLILHKFVSKYYNIQFFMVVMLKQMIYIISKFIYGNGQNGYFMKQILTKSTKLKFMNKFKLNHLK